MKKAYRFGGVAAVVAVGVAVYFYASYNAAPDPSGAPVGVASAPSASAPSGTASPTTEVSKPTPQVPAPTGTTDKTPAAKPPAARPSTATPPAASPTVALAAAPKPDDAAQPAAPRFDIVRVAPDGATVIAGRATPGASVTVRDGDKSLGSVTADKRGEWVLLPDQPLAPGTRELSLAEKKSAEAAPVPSDKVVVVMVPDAAPAKDGGATTQPSGPLAVAVPRVGMGPSTVLQAPSTDDQEQTSKTAGAAPPPPPGGVSVESVDYDAAGHVAMGGRAQPGSAVQLYLDNLMVGRAHTDPDGHWRLSPERPITPGIYKLRADQVTDAGKVTARVELPVQVSKVPDSLPDGRSVVVQPGNSLWRIARSTYGQGVRYTMIYEANRSQIRDPDLIYPGQIFALPVAN